MCVSPDFQGEYLLSDKVNVLKIRNWILLAGCIFTEEKCVSSNGIGLTHITSKQFFAQTSKH